MSESAKKFDDVNDVHSLLERQTILKDALRKLKDTQRKRAKKTATKNTEIEDADDVDANEYDSDEDAHVEAVDKDLDEEEELI